MEKDATPKTPLRALDAEGWDILGSILNGPKHASLAVLDPTDGLPNISRIALVRGPDGAPLSLISDLSAHAGALKSNPEAALLIGEPGPKGDPLTHPRLSLRVRARIVRHGEAEHELLAAHYLLQQPKAKLYIGFADFALVDFEIRDGLLNGGFGKAFPITAEDVLSV